eukprot:scaffold193320_cov69-Cyclotella_meneghiniana.AAC.3
MYVFDAEYLDFCFGTCYYARIQELYHGCSLVPRMNEGTKRRDKADWKTIGRYFNFNSNACRLVER